MRQSGSIRCARLSLCVDQTTLVTPEGKQFMAKIGGDAKFGFNGAFGSIGGFDSTYRAHQLFAASVAVRALRRG